MKNDVTSDVINDVINNATNFSPSLMHSLNVYLQYLWSGKAVSFMVLSQSDPPIDIQKRHLSSIYLSPGFLLQFGENRGSGKHTSQYPIELKFSTNVNND